MLKPTFSLKIKKHKEKNCLDCIHAKQQAYLNEFLGCEINDSIVLCILNNKCTDKNTAKSCDYYQKKDKGV